MKVKVSVVVPVYNVEEYLPRCLDSLIGQSYKEIKVICVDDGSTDGSLDILKEYRKRDKRITIITKENGGLSSARNAGLNECDTDYVMFCDSDDYYSSRMCEKMLFAIEEDDSDLAICAQHVIYSVHNEMEESDRNYYRLKYTGKQYIDAELVLKTDVSVVNKIFRMDIINKYNIRFPEGINNEDFYFYNAYMSVSDSISFVNQKLYNYVRRDGSIMSENFEAEKMSMDHLLVAERLFDFYGKTDFLEKHKDLFWRQWVLSFWFSVEHSSKKYRKDIVNRAKEFAQKEYALYKPEDKNLRKEVNYILSNNIWGKIKRRLRRDVIGFYKRINVGYRNRSRINAELEDLVAKNEELLDRLNNLEDDLNEKK